MSASAGHNKQNGADPRNHTNGAPEPDVLEVLSGFQASVENLKTLYAQRAAATAKLEERESELASRTEQLQTLEQELEERRAAAHRDREAFEQVRSETERRAEEIAARTAEAEKVRREIEQARTDVQRTRTEAERARVDAGARMAEAEKAHAEIERMRVEAEQARAEADRAREEMVARSEEFRATQAEVEAARNAVEAQRRAVEASAAEVKARDAALRTKSAEREAAGAKVGEMEKQLRDARAALAAEQAKARDGDQALRRQLADAVKARDDLARKSGAGASADAKVRSELDALTRKHAELQAAHDARTEELAAEQAKARDGDQELRRQLADAIKARDDLTRKSGAGASADAKVRSELGALTRKHAELQAAHDARAQELAAEREAAKRAAAEMEAGKKSGGAGDDRAKLQKAAKALVDLRSERDKMHAELGRLREQVAQMSDHPAGERAPKGRENLQLEIRRRRVTRYRALVKEQSEKVKKATETLRSRFEAAEKLVAQRAELAEAHTAVKTAERRAERAKSKGRVASLMFYGLASSLVLGFMCWAGAGWLAPGTYVATSVLEAESRTREINDGERAEWQSFHEQLLADPQFHDYAAERFNRRGIPTYGTAGAVRELVQNSVQTHSSGDGQLVLEMRGEGGERTARVLDTLATALASDANASHRKRVDGAATAMRQAATASEHPIDNTRLVYAALSWAISLMLSFAVASVLWRRMLQAKSTFERATRVDEILDESRWQALPTTAGARKGRPRMGGL